MKTAQMLEMKILLLHGLSNGFRVGFRVEGWGCDNNLHGRLSKYGPFKLFDGYIPEKGTRLLTA